MNRRQLLKLISAGLIGAATDIDKLLWIPGEKTIFIPPVKPFSYSAIMASEWEKVMPNIAGLFERDDLFYATIKGGVRKISGDRPLRIPLIIKPGE